MNGSKLLHIDFGLLIPAIVLVFLSLVTLSSVNSLYVKNQLLSFGVSIAAFIFFAQIHYNVLKIQGKAIYILSIVLLLIVLIIGFESRGAVRWITIAGFQIQFSEILKPFLAISLASFLSKRKLSLLTLIQCVFLLLPVVFLIFLQPDLGNALLYLIIAMCSLIVIGFALIWFILGIILAAVCAPVFWLFLHDYQRQRILTFFHPSNDPLGTSYNAVQSIIAVGSGSFFGKGLGEATQSGLRFLPERHTDFIFATLSEGLGLLGALLLLLASCFYCIKLFEFLVIRMMVFVKYLLW
jgi:rod shape determining protein RodA